MVRLALITTLSTLSLYAAPYWIQVSSVEGHKSITPSFITKIKKSGFSYKVVEEQGRKKVFLGSFDHYKEALKTLPKVRCKIAYDAFIVNNSVKKKPTKTVKKVEKKPQTAKLPIATQATPPPQPCDCVYDVHGLRKSEIERALQYYKAADYYEFKKK